MNMYGVVVWVRVRVEELVDAFIVYLLASLKISGGEYWKIVPRMGFVCRN